MAYKFVTLAEHPGFVPSSFADDYSANWLKTHGVLLQGPRGFETVDDVIPVSFRTIETSLPTTGFHADTETPFQSDVGSLRIRGVKKGSTIEGQVGLSPTPSVFYALHNFKGDLAQGPVDTGNLTNPFYKGQVVISQGNASDANPGGVVAKVDWLGAGVQLAGQLLSLIPH